MNDASHARQRRSTRSGGESDSPSSLVEIQRRQRTQNVGSFFQADRQKIRPRSTDLPARESDSPRRRIATRIPNGDEGEWGRVTRDARWFQAAATGVAPPDWGVDHCNPALAEWRSVELLVQPWTFSRSPSGRDTMLRQRVVSGNLLRLRKVTGVAWLTRKQS